MEQEYFRIVFRRNLTGISIVNEEAHLTRKINAAFPINEKSYKFDKGLIKREEEFFTKLCAAWLEKNHKYICETILFIFQTTNEEYNNQILKLFHIIAISLYYPAHE